MHFPSMRIHRFSCNNSSVRVHALPSGAHQHVAVDGPLGHLITQQYCNTWEPSYVRIKSSHCLYFIVVLSAL